MQKELPESMTSQPKIAPYGSWKSPVTSDLMVAGSLTLSGVLLDGDDVFWMEGRPAEGGRNVLVRRGPDGAVADAIPPGFNARSRVHEYGGGAALVADGSVYFSNFTDQRLYRHALKPRDSEDSLHLPPAQFGEPSQAPEPLTPALPLRYADAVLDASRGRLVCVREDHREVGSGAGHEPLNTIVAVRTDGGNAQDGGEALVSGNDFYASPRISVDGRYMAWITWRHPNMPWDGTELWVAPVQNDGLPGAAQLVAGGLEESIFQPEWSLDGGLYFVSDRTGWWNLYRWTDAQGGDQNGSQGGVRGTGSDGGKVEALTELEAEFGQPQWQFGLSCYAFESPGRIVCRYVQAGDSRLAVLDVATRTLEDVPVPFTSIASVRAQAGRVAFIGGSPSTPSSVVLLDLGTGGVEILRRASDLEMDDGYLSAAQPVEFPTEGGLTAHGFFYPPRNRDFAGASTGERPPLLVKSHGGPTSATTSTLDLGTQYWTSRGFAVLDVNYGGSTGYGRAYRERLRGQWGVVDVDDCVNGARWLADQGLVDGGRLAIKGGSAGGYTTLCALTFRDTFHAGASHYGVSDLEALAKETHKFEARYLDSLVGPYPERRDLYVERSPVHHAQQLSCPVIFFQGLDDPVVPPNQAEMMVEALESKRVPVAYVAFEGEQHGFRRAENIKRAVEAELYFYSRVFGFTLADPIEPVAIYAEERLATRA